MSHLRSARSTEAPMDWDYTSRKSVEPVWARKDDPATPKKLSKRMSRSFNRCKLATSSTTTPSSPMFGANRNVPLSLMRRHPRQRHPSPMGTPPNFSPTKPIFEPEVHDVDMSEATPPQAEEKRGRSVAAGALRRVYKSRTKARQKNNDHKASQKRMRVTQKMKTKIREWLQLDRALRTTIHCICLHRLFRSLIFHIFCLVLLQLSVDPAVPVPRGSFSVMSKRGSPSTQWVSRHLYAIGKLIALNEFSASDIVQEIAMCATQYRTIAAPIRFLPCRTNAEFGNRV
ncbi:Di-sulfide bridge nucleocytoplasmic transport domain-containing [Salix suchowensis]|nr:Di-sulfide bridge nucleocytoplasmic transport domain-containing [Salix suchowensis]